MINKKVRVRALCFLILAMFGLCSMLASIQVTAQDVSGTWTSRITGEGMVIGTYYADYHYDVQLSLTQDADSVNGVLKRTCSKVDINVEGWESALDAVGTSENLSASGTLSNSIFTLVISDSEGTYTFPLTVAGDTMTGSGQYTTQPSQTTIDYSFDLVGGSSGDEEDTDTSDTDEDGLPDIWEIENFGNLTQSGTDDFDGDGLTNREEYEFGTDPAVYQKDSDGDELPDLWEIKYFGDLSKRANRDTDSDGHNNLQEYEAGSDPNDPLDEPEDTDADELSDTWEMENFNSLGQDEDDDFDDDGYTNIEEYLDGSDPNDITDYPYTSSEPEDLTNLKAGLATLVMVAIFGIAIYANARRHKKRRGPREWTTQQQQPPYQPPDPPPPPEP